MKNKNKRSVIVLCGGMSRRMGEDKGSMDIDKKPMIIHVLQALTYQVDEVIIVLNDSKRITKYKSLIQEYLDKNYNDYGNHGDYGDNGSFSESDNQFDFDIIFVEDEIKNKGPLSGIMTGLKTISSDYGLVLPCDTPYISSDFVNHMFNTLNNVRRADICSDMEGIVPYHTTDEDSKKVNLNNTEPLHSIYKKENFSIIENLLKSDEKRVKSFISVIDIYFIPISDVNSKINEINFKNINYKDDYQDN